MTPQGLCTNSLQGMQGLEFHQATSRFPHQLDGGVSILFLMLALHIADTSGLL